VYFNLRNVLRKSGTFPPGHPVFMFECVKILILLNFKTLEEALHKTPYLFKVNVICICKKETSFILILPSFMYVFVLSHLSVTLVGAETFSKLM